METMQKCRSWLGHRYRARWDTRPGIGRINIEGNTTADALARVIEAYRIETYICDVCTRCGHVIKREEG